MHSAFFSQILSGKKILLNTNKILGRDIFFFLCREFLLHFILFIYLILCGDIIVSSSEVFFWGCRILKKFTKRFFSFEKYRWLIDGNQECFFFFFFVCFLFSQVVPRIHHEDRGGSCPTTSERRKLFGEEQRIDQTRLFFIVEVSWFYVISSIS